MAWKVFWPFVLRPFFRVIGFPPRMLWRLLNNVGPTYRFIARRHAKWARHRKELSEAQDKRKKAAIAAGRSVAQAVFPSSHIPMQPGVAEDTGPVELVQLFNEIGSGSEMQHMNDLRDRAIFSTPNAALALEKLRGVTCEPGSRASCWACGIGICALCKVHTEAQVPLTTCHLAQCTPRCSSCYYNTECQNKYRKSLWSSPCNVHKVRTTANLKEKAGELRDLCRACAASSPEIVREAREEREVQEMRHLAKGILRCGLCKRTLGKKGPRWWVCDCLAECSSEYHAAWGVKS
jgi:hypothetical protein